MDTDSGVDTDRSSDEREPSGRQSKEREDQERPTGPQRPARGGGGGAVSTMQVVVDARSVRLVRWKVPAESTIGGVGRQRRHQAHGEDPPREQLGRTGHGSQHLQTKNLCLGIPLRILHIQLGGMSMRPSGRLRNVTNIVEG